MLTYDELLHNSGELITIYRTYCPLEYYLTKIDYNQGSGDIVMKVQICLKNIKDGSDVLLTFLISETGVLTGSDNIPEIMRIMTTWLKKIRPCVKRPKLFDSGVFYDLPKGNIQ